MRWAMTRLNMHASQVKFSNSVNIMGTVIVIYLFIYFLYQFTGKLPNAVLHCNVG